MPSNGDLFAAVRTPSDEQWAALRADLAREAQAWQTALRTPSNSLEMTGVLASAVHLAYHLGAIRQINRKMRGPQARD